LLGGDVLWTSQGLITIYKTNANKRSRGAVSREDVYAFFDNFVKAAEDVPQGNMFNYNET
jgi:hypothetical protein